MTNAPPPAAFFANYLSGSLTGRPPDELQRLLRQHADALLDESPPPEDFPAWETVEANLRPAITATLTPTWLAFFEYHAAWRACAQGDPTAMAAAAERLDRLDRQNPELAYQRPQRQMLLADMLRALGEFALAAAALDRAAKDLGDDATAKPTLHSNLHGLRSEILRENGRMEDAAAAMARSLQLAFASGDRLAIERALVRDQALTLATGRFSESIAAIERHLATTELADGVRTMLTVFLGHAQSGLAGEDPDLLLQAKATLDSVRARTNGHLRVRTDLKRFDLALRLGDTRTATAAAADCDQSLGAAMQATPPGRDACERIGLGTRLLLLCGADADELRAGLARQAVAEAELQRQWGNQPARAGGIGFLHLTQRRDLLGAGIAARLALARAEHRSDGPAEAMQVLLDLQIHTTLARARSSPRCTVTDIQQSLAPERGILVYLPTRSTTFTFLIERDALAHEELPGDLPADPTLQAFQAALARGPDLAGDARAFALDELARNAAAARERLLPGALGRRTLALRQLTIVGADLLGGIAFEALALPDGRLLGEEIAIDNTGTLPWVLALHATHRPTAPAAARLLMLGCTTPAFAFPHDALGDSLTGYANVQGIYDAELTRAAFLGAGLRTAAVVHVTAHGVPAADDLHGPGLQFADGPLHRSDLPDRVAGVFIVSACGGGAGPGRQGEGESFGSLVGGLLCNGATAVIASRRGLPALDHLQLLAHCHRQLAAGASPAAAMQQARARMATAGDLLLRGHRAQMQVFGAGQLAPIAAR